MSYENLSGRTAVVTGAASGIGEAVALHLAAEGARVALLARRADRLRALAEKIRAEGGQALAVTADVTDDASVEAARDQVRAEFGAVDLVVNNAGVMLPNPVDEGRLDEWRRMLDTNVTGVLRIIRAFTGDLVAAAAEGRTADLVNVSSVGAHVTFPHYAVYGATKAAVTYLSQSLRGELGPRDVRVTNIEPGLTETELRTHVADAELSGQLDGLFEAIGGLSAAEVADVVAYAASRPRHVNLRQIVVLPTRQA
ncbi:MULTISPECIES: SDR family oxidoreductase [Streptomyces]|uniref:SDR family oxidoreductase n=2 Tax=Streptomyces TaxID=1883 RepID=A0ABS9JII5_9ACTN|nr:MULTISPECIES: SDR family oxidoreductase [Streptomyces]MYU28827.1 SDR family NAD(P)-dependent oxidoreductase [Streptomyces sp. SID7810]CUW29870.1 Serine 3-dehydrogenase [Streptomyces reticuli]MCG0065309.1 SDR family oxidoreductase [Streptomyces tricolor]OYP17202.1 NAD(P)-dependent oxidoreductase [Streptomyces sp. FBKL.4005]BCM67360.1 ketoreductase [Streptomyces sp. EAS-AB2608]